MYHKVAHISSGIQKVTQLEKWSCKTEEEREKFTFEVVGAFCLSIENGYSLLNLFGFQ